MQFTQNNNNNNANTKWKKKKKKKKIDHTIEHMKFALKTLQLRVKILLDKSDQPKFISKSLKHRQNSRASTNIQVLLE